jgi:hypothetical protein
VPLRAAPLFAAALKATVPLPDPDAPLEIVIHAAFDTAVHVQPLFAVTAALPLPPAESIDWLAGEIAYVHAGGGTAGCETVSVAPAIVSVAVRAAPPFAAAV